MKHLEVRQKYSADCFRFLCFYYFLQRVKNGMYVKNIVLELYYYDICLLLSRFLLAAFVQLFNADAVKGT